MTARATLVLAGGGAKGAFQVGALLALREMGYTWEYVYGVSVGALNGALVAAGKLDDLRAVWSNLVEDDVFHRYGWPRIVWRIMRHKLSVYDNTPLLATVTKHIPTAPPHCKVGVVGLSTGAYYLQTATPGMVYASATMPVVWEPVAGEFVDGGVRNQTPLAAAIDAGAEHIVCILCNPRGEMHHAAAPQNIIDVAHRALDIALTEIAEGDLSECERINALVSQASTQGVVLRKDDGTPYRPVQLTIIAPAESLGDTLDFSHASIVRRMAAGDAAVRTHYRRTRAA